MEIERSLSKIMKKKLFITTIAVAILVSSVYAATKCIFCNGTGWKGSYKCGYCGGDGEI